MYIVIIVVSLILINFRWLLRALALIWPLKHFEVYVGSGGESLVIYTDHSPLMFLCSLPNPNQWLTRWCVFLQGYHLDIRHIKDTDNVIVDALSWV